MKKNKSRLKGEASRLAIIVLLATLFVATAVGTANINLARDSYALGEPIDISVTTDRAYMVSIVSPNSVTSDMGICIGDCEMQYRPSIVETGTHWIIIQNDSQIVYNETFQITGSEPDKISPDTKPESKSMPRIQEIVIPAEGKTGSKTIEVTDSEGFVYLISAERVGESYLAEIPSSIDVSNSRILTADQAQLRQSEATQTFVQTPEILQVASHSEESTVKIRGAFGKSIRSTNRIIKSKGVSIQTIGDKLEVIPEGLPFSKIVFNDIETSGIENKTLHIDELPLTIKKGALKAYAVDPTELNFTTAELTSVAEGKVVMKCKDFNFTTQECFGEWVELMRVTPGENYTLLITPDDPAFTEFDETYITDDVYVMQNSPTSNYNTGALEFREHNIREERIYMRWDIANLPANIKVTNATLHMYLSGDKSSNEISPFHVYDNTWDGQTESTMTWNNQVCGTDFTDTADCNTTANDNLASTGVGWKIFDVTRIVNKEVEQDSSSVSFAMKYQTYTSRYRTDTYQSSEGTAGQRPILNVSYIFKPTVTLLTPFNGSTAYTVSNDFSFRVIDDTTTMACTLWGNFSGTWENNKTFTGVLNNSVTETSLNLSTGSYVWNVMCNDTQDLYSFASANNTLIVVEPVVYTNSTSFLVDEDVLISGQNWPPFHNITLDILNPSSMSQAGYPVNITTNAGGQFSSTWTVPVESTGGTYTVVAEITNNSEINSEGSFAIQDLKITTSKSDYVREEVVTINSEVFKAGEDVRLYMYNPFDDPVAGYPKIIAASGSGNINDTWSIPADATLGTYTLNATEINNPDRSVEDTFEIVTAVIEGDNTTYEQGMTVDISGYSWDNLVDVTINITGPSGTTVYPVHNRTSNSSGGLNDSWTIPYDADIGTYVINAYEPSNPTKIDDYTFTVIARPVNITINYTWYKRDEKVDIIGTGFAPGNNVNIDIINSTGQSVTGYPKISVSNSSGGLNDSWTIPADQMIDNYTISMEDATYTNLAESSTIMVVIQQIETDFSSYKSGEIVHVTGGYWERNSNVVLEIANISGTVASGYPKIVPVSPSGTFADNWIAQPGTGFSAEIYNISAEQQTDATIDTWTTISVTKSASLFTDKANYIYNDTVSINGSFYSPLGDVKLWITSVDNNGTAMGYPITIQTDSESDINSTWDTSNYCAGTYRVASEDQTYPDQLHATSTFAISFSDNTTKTCTDEWGVDCSLWPSASESDNTFDSCPTSIGGDPDEHVNEVSLNATVVQPGESVEVTCTFDPYSTGTEEYIYYYDGSSWTQLYGASAPGSAIHDVSATVDVGLDEGTHWFRCIADWDGEADECADVGSYYDNDDASLTVVKQPSSCIVFDTTPPEVKELQPFGTAYYLGDSVNITANITDNWAVSTVIVTITYPDTSTVDINMLDPDSDNIFDALFNTTTMTGLYRYGVWANDSWGVINNSEEGNFTVGFATLDLRTAKQSYIRTETVEIFGEGYNTFVDVTITISNSSGILPGYPKNVTSNATGGINDSWIIPGTQQLGEYTINASDTSNLSRKASTIFDIVTAVIESEKMSYEQGTTINITGYNWDMTVDVTINITDPVGSLIYGPFNITSNSSGGINTSWEVAYDALLGDYLLSAIEPSSPSKSDTYTFTVISRIAGIQVEYPWYKRDETINITGYDYSPSSVALLNITNNSGSVPGYPQYIEVDSNGEINYTLAAATLSEDNYFAYAEDNNYSNLNDTVLFTVVSSFADTTKEIYGTGEYIVITGNYWDRGENVTINVTDSTGTVIYSEISEANSDGEISDSFLAPIPTGSGETFNVTVYRSGDSLDIYEFNFTVILRATLDTDKPTYDQNENVTFSGSYYTPNGEVQIGIRCNSLGVYAEYYPKKITADGLGNIVHEWNVSYSCYDGYYAEAIDLTEPEILYANTTFDAEGTMYTVFFDGFESGDFTTGDWDYLNAVVDTRGPHTGSYAAHITSIDRYISKTFNFSNIENANLSFWARGTSFEGAEYVQINIYDGSWHYNEITITIDDGVYYHHDLDLSQYNMVDNFQIEWRTKLSGGGDHIYIDDVNVTGNDVTAPCTTFDNTYPSLYEITPADESFFNLSNNINITANISDNRGIWEVYTTVTNWNGTAVNLTMTDIDTDGVYNATYSDTEHTGEFTYRVTVKDTSSNIVMSGIRDFTINDVIKPRWYNNDSSPRSGSTYKNNQYQFNVTWTDNYNLTEVWVEHNFTGTMNNYSTSNLSTEYYYDYTNIAAGSYSWRMYANDNSGNLNMTPQFIYTILKNSSKINLSADGSNTSITIEVHSTINLNIEALQPTDGTVEMYLDKVLINSGTGTTNNLTQFSTLGVYNLTGKFPESENYSYNDRTIWITVEDTTDPGLIKIDPADDLNTELNTTVNITAKVTDNFEIDSVWARIWNSIIDITKELFDIGGDTWQTKITTNDSFIGITNYTILVNDSSGNTLNISGNFTTLGEPHVLTDKQSYIIGETVYLNGRGFSLFMNTTIFVYNNSEIMSGYPINITTDEMGKLNDSWLIPAAQTLGQYTVNMTDGAGRTANLTFDIVTAVVEAHTDTIEQGNMLNISGYSWDSLVDVTINITDPSGTIVYGPINDTSNATSGINASWFVPYNATYGDYIVSAIQPSNVNKTDTFTFAVNARTVTAVVNESWFKDTEHARVSGTGYVPSANVTIDIYNASLESAPGFPIERTADSKGAINYTWVIPVAARLDNYTVFAISKDFSNLNATTELRIVTESIYLNSDTFNNGDTVVVTGAYWDRLKNITVDIFNQTLDSVSLYPENITADADGRFTATWTAQTQGISNTVYNVTAYHPYDSTTEVNLNFTVLVAATIATDRSYYTANEEMLVTGSYYTALNDVSITIENTVTGSYASPTPYLTTANGIGNVSYAWNVTNYCEGTYRVTATDVSYPELLHASTTIEVDHFEANLTAIDSSGYTLSGSFNNNNTGLERVYSSNDDWLWFGGKDPTGTVVMESWIEFNFSIASLNLTSNDKVIDLNLSMEYCHSGLQTTPECGIGTPHEGETNGVQEVQVWNYVSSSWHDLDALIVNETSPTERNQEWLISYPASDFISEGMIRYRFEVNFTEDNSDDDLLMIDRLDLDVRYRSDIVVNCTLVDDIIGNLSDINVTGINTEMDVGGATVNFTRDYSGVKLIEIFNGTIPLVRFYHNFSTGPLYTSDIDIVVLNRTVSAKIPGHNFTLIVPLVDNQCNVLICEGTLKKEGCDSSNYTLYPTPEGQYCPVTVDGTWAQDAPDKTDFEILQSGIDYSSETREGKNVSFNVTIYNRGNTKVKNLTFEIYDNTSSERIYIVNITEMGPKSSTVIYDINWTANIGKNVIEVRVDPYNDYGEYNETNNNASVEIYTDAWQVLYGDILSNITFHDEAGNLAYTWEPDIHIGNLYIADSDSTVNWNNLNALGRDKNGLAATSDFNDIDTNLGMVNFEDNISSMFSSDGTTAKDTISLDIFSRTVTDIPITNSTNSSSFITGILWDGSDSIDDEYNVEEEDLIFVTRINESTPGKYGTYDYEIKAPALLRKYKGTTDTVNIYVELI